MAHRRKALCLCSRHINTSFCPYHLSLPVLSGTSFSRLPHVRDVINRPCEFSRRFPAVFSHGLTWAHISPREDFREMSRLPCDKEPRGILQNLVEHINTQTPWESLTKLWNKLTLYMWVCVTWPVCVASESMSANYNSSKVKKRGVKNVTWGVVGLTTGWFCPWHSDTLP